MESPSGGHGEGEIFDPAKYRPTSRGFVWVTVVFVLVLGALVAAGVIPRLLHRATLEADEKQAAIDIAKVRVARVEHIAAGGALSLPGSVQPLQETSIYARANGYVRKWLVDIGAPVTKGQILVELDVPDIDEQLRQAEASAKQAEAGISQAKTQLELARTTNQRYGALGPSGVVSKQEIEQYQKSNVAAAEAAYGSAVANVRRYKDLQSFATIQAPFDGVVTMRAAEVGQLVVSGTGQGAVLFKVAEVDIVRVFVNVPQLYAGGIKVGMNAPTRIREAPGRIFAGKVARTANELDFATRSLLTEIDIPNPDRALISGMYAQVSFDVSRQDQPLVVPATSVLFDALGTRIAIIDNGVVHWSKVEVASDLGDKLALTGGVRDGQFVAINPSEHLVDGMRVHPEERNADGTPKPSTDVTPADQPRTAPAPPLPSASAASVP
jgi:RND family efflux transporter MFP subunit